MTKSIAKFMLIGFIFLGASSCKKKKIQESVVNPQPEQIAKKVLLPVRFESEKLTITLKYNSNTPNLIEVSDSEDYSTSITYKNEQPYEIITARKGKEFKLVDYTRTKENEPKARSFDYTSPVYVPTGYDILTYDEQARLIKMKQYKDGGELFQQTSMQYTSGNVSTRTVAAKAEESVAQIFSYDTKNGVFQNIKYPERIIQYLRYSFLNIGQNNLLKITNPDVSFSYLYNPDDYPSQITFTQNKVSQTYKITYTELKL
jgi:hypothetical protein